MTEIPAALKNMLEPLVELERLEQWSGSNTNRFFEISKFGYGEWEATIYLDPESAAERGIVDGGKSLCARGQTMPAAISAVLEKFESGVSE